MKALALLMFMLGVMAVLLPDRQWEAQEPQYQAVAINFITFRNAVMHRVFVDRDRQPGPVTAEQLRLPQGWRPLRAWSARITETQCLVFGAAETEVVTEVRK